MKKNNKWGYQTLLATWAIDSARVILNEFKNELSDKQKREFSKGVITLVCVFFESWINLIHYWYAKSFDDTDKRDEVLKIKYFYKKLSLLVDKEWETKCDWNNCERLKEEYIKSWSSNSCYISPEEIERKWEEELRYDMICKVKQEWIKICQEFSRKITEIFIVRDTCVHNHGWFYVSDENWDFGDPILVNDEIECDWFGDKKYINHVDSKKRKTKYLKLNVVNNIISTDDLVIIVDFIDELKTSLKYYGIKHTFSEQSFSHSFENFIEEYKEIFK